MWVDGVHGLLVGAARDRGRRRQQPDASGARQRDGAQRLGAHDAEDVDAERRLHHAPLQGRQRGGGRRVARDDQQLHAPPQELLGDLGREAHELVLGALAVGEAGGVPQIQEVLARERDEQLVQDRQTADAGVEHPDRARPRVRVRPRAAVAGLGEARHAGHHSRALPSAARARAGRLEHAARHRPPRARALRARPGRGPARPGGAGGRAVRVRARRPRPVRRRARAAPLLSPRGAGRGARPFRADGVAGPRGPGAGAGADGARDRRAPPAHPPGNARGVAADGADRRGLAGARRRAAGPRGAPPSAGAAVRRGHRALPPAAAHPRHGSRSASTPTGPTSCSPPTRRARRSATTARSRFCGRWPRRRRRGC